MFGLESKCKFKPEIKLLKFRVFQSKGSKDMNRNQLYDRPDTDVDIGKKKLSLKVADLRSS